MLGQFREENAAELVHLIAGETSFGVSLVHEIKWNFKRGNETTKTQSKERLNHFHEQKRTANYDLFTFLVARTYKPHPPLSAR